MRKWFKENPIIKYLRLLVLESISDPLNWCLIIVNNFFIPFCDTFDIPGNALKNITPIKIHNIDLKKVFFIKNE